MNENLEDALSGRVNDLLLKARFKSEVSFYDAYHQETNNKVKRAALECIKRGIEWYIPKNLYKASIF